MHDADVSAGYPTTEWDLGHGHAKRPEGELGRSRRRRFPNHRRTDTRGQGSVDYGGS